MPKSDKIADAAAADRALQTPRRGFLRAIGALALAGLPAAARALPAHAPAPAFAAPAPDLADTDLLDADLFDAVDRWRIVDARLSAARAANSAAVDATAWPEPPEALFERLTDGMFLPTQGLVYPSPHQWMQYFENAGSFERDAARGAYTRRVGGASFEVKLKRREKARIAEIVAAARDHRAARKAASEASGLAAARAELDEAERAAQAVQKEILEIPARTFTGAVEKAGVVADVFHGFGGLEEHFARLFSGGPMALALGVVLDLAWIDAAQRQDGRQTEA